MANPLKHLSVTALDEFLRCPRRFRLHRIDRVRPTFRSMSLAFGTAWHDMIGYLLFQHARGETHRRKELVERFRGSLADQLTADEVPVLFDEGETEHDLANAAAGMLDAFLGVVALPEKVHAIEHRFECELVDPRTGEVLPPLTGSVDAIVEYDGRLELWELKSGKRRWDESKLTHDFQLTAYRMAMRSEGIKDPRLRLVVVTKTKKPDVQLESLVRSRRDEAELADTAVQVCRAIEADAFVKNRSWACKSCPFAEACG